MMTKFTLPKPDDMHLHVRQGSVLEKVVPQTAKQFGRAVIMPNTTPPITSLEGLRKYREEIWNAIPNNTNFAPLMTMYLSPEIIIEDIIEGKESGDLHALKMYPFGVTTNSEQGAKTIDEVSSQLKVMEEHLIPLLIHGEDSNPETDVFDREKVFYEKTLPEIIKKYPKLKITCEHITTQVAAEFIKSAPKNIGATITPQHLLCDRNDMLGKSMNPHLYCKPILKRKEDQEALIDLVKSGHPRVFAGTDSAPHTKENKESCCGCAGVYSASCAVELYGESFDTFGDLSKKKTQELFISFISRNGANFYDLPINEETITLSKEEQVLPAYFETETGEKLIPWRAGEKIAWTAS